MNYQCKAKQAEAKSSLGSIRVAQEAYFAEYDTYSTDQDAIGFATQGDNRYTYVITPANANGFTATATADDLKGSTDDIWTINSTGDLTNTSNACSG